MIRALAVAAAAFLTMATPLIATAAAQAPANVMGYSSSDLNGQWQGAYFSGDAGTPFVATLSHDGQRVIGSTTEPNGFGDPNVAYLLADLNGTLRAGRLTLDKTYNGVGGQTHTVRYVGTVSRDGRRITGSWNLDGVSGRFEMVR
ncbi:MAG: hypothetical protein ACOYKM_11200 [Caulobacterales bacterium]|jgi:hypothetical protein